MGRNSVFTIVSSRVDDDKIAQVSDFGLSRDVYDKDYYRQSKDRPLPIKWMAIECLFDEKVYTNESDVVSIQSITELFGYL